MFWLCLPRDRASPRAEARCQREFICGRRRRAVLPGGGLHAPQLDLAPGGPRHPGPRGEGEGALRLVLADQRRASSRCRGVPLCGRQRPRRQQNHCVAPCSRYGRMKPRGQLLKHLRHRGPQTPFRPPSSGFHYRLNLPAVGLNHFPVRNVSHQSKLMYVENCSFYREQDVLCLQRAFSKQPNNLPVMMSYIQS